MTLTVKQLKGASQEHPDDAWKVDGCELHQVKIVGNVLNVDEQSTFTKYDIEDSTGVVEVKLWLDAGDDDAMSERRSQCREGAYVRVIGTVRSFQNTLHVVSHDVRPVEDHNQITHHFLEAIFQHCQRTKAPPVVQGGGSWSQAGAPAQSNQLKSSIALEDNAGGASNDCNAMQNEVLSFFNQNDSPDDDGTGLSLDVVAASLQQKGIQERDVRSAVEYLANEGHLYSTIDDNHYKSTA